LVIFHHLLTSAAILQRASDVIVVFHFLSAMGRGQKRAPTGCAKPEASKCRRGAPQEAAAEVQEHDGPHTAAAARKTFTVIVGELLRLDILGIRQLTDASDIHRLKVTAQALFSFNIERWQVAAILALDWAVRSPELTATFLQNLRDEDHKPDFANVSEFLMYRDLLRSKDWRTWWKGPSRINLLHFAKEVSVDDLMVFGYKFQESSQRLRVTAVLEEMTHWKNIGPYLSYNMLRCVAAGMHVRLRDASRAATSMSPHTQHLTDLLDLKKFRKELRVVSGVNACDGLLSFYICETAKLLKEKRVLKNLKHYENNSKELIEDLTSDAAQSFFTNLKEFGHLPVPAGPESQEVSALLPDASNAVHTTTNTLQRMSFVVGARCHSL
jgi:hypothetical protein